MHAGALEVADTRNEGHGSIEFTLAESDGVVLVALVNRVDDELRSRELALVESGVAPVIVTTFEDNLVRGVVLDGVRARNDRVLVHHELLHFVETLFGNERFKHVSRHDADGLEEVHHRKRVVALVLGNDEGNAFSNGSVRRCRFGLEGIHMDCGNLFGGVDGTVREDELHIVGVHLLAVAPLGGGVQVNHDAVVVGEFRNQRAKKGFDLTVQGVVGDERFVHQVEAATHRPCSHPAFGERVERSGGTPLLARQVKRLLTGQGAFGGLLLAAAITPEKGTCCRNNGHSLDNRFNSDHVYPLIVSLFTTFDEIRILI